MMIYFSTPTGADLGLIADHLCEADRNELAAQGHDSALEVILAGVRDSRECLVASWGGRPQAVFGVADYVHDHRHGVPWLLSTGTAGSVAVPFMAASRRFIGRWRGLYASLFNLVDARHVTAQLWLTRLGFLPWKVHDINGHPFIEFGILNV